jgi:glyceraldehyde-3-phosphate dehydrogenase/erythrose-4-phosphate dehydrogenase
MCSTATIVFGAEAGMALDCTFNKVMAWCDNE